MACLSPSLLGSRICEKNERALLANVEDLKTMWRSQSFCYKEESLSMSSLSRFLLAGMFCLLPIAAFAQQVTYLDENLKPTSASSYTYKRVLQYQGSVLNPNLGIGYYGNATAHITQTGLHNCSLIDYYKSGQPATVLSVRSLSPDCNHWSPNGPGIFYYPSGHIKQRAYYNAGKLQGDVTTYNEDGSIQGHEHYENGILIDTKTFAVSPKHPLLGTWKYLHYGPAVPGLSPKPDFAATDEFLQNGTLVSSSMRYAGFVEPIALTSTATKQVVNWKYIIKTSKTGTLEEYRGTELLGRGDVTWINGKQIELVTTFSTDPNKVGTHSTWTHQ